MFKSLIQRIEEQHGGQVPLTPTLNPQTVARSFGVAIDVGESLHESAYTCSACRGRARKVSLLLDLRTSTPKPAPKSLFAIATARLQSIKPRTKERAQQVAQLGSGYSGTTARRGRDV